MPALLGKIGVFLVGPAIGWLGGFFTGQGVNGFGNLVKWGVIGTLAFFTAKQLGVIK